MPITALGSLAVIAMATGLPESGSVRLTTSDMLYIDLGVWGVGVWGPADMPFFRAPIASGFGV